MSKLGCVVIVSVMLFGSSADAQTRTPDPLWQFWLRAQGQNYGNFFQRTEGQRQDSVQGLFAELGGSVGVRSATPLRAYANVNILRFSEGGLSTSPGVRAGMRNDGRPHAFDVYVERLQDRPSFDIGDGFDKATMTNIGGEYSYRISRDWQVSVDGEMQMQDIAITSSRDNEYRGAGAAVRWRRSRLFSPEIGFRTGRREVVDDTLSYDQNEMYLQVRSSPTPSIYISARYRDRGREYTNGREDERRQLSAAVDWSMTRVFVWNFYVARETVRVNRAGRDLSTGLYAIGATRRF